MLEELSLLSKERKTNFVGLGGQHRCTPLHT